MTQTTRVFVLVILFAAGAVVEVMAQPAPFRRGFAHLNLAYQGREHIIEGSGAFTIYNERATFDTRQEIDRGALFDIGAGARVWRELYVGIGFTKFSDKGDAAINASIPDPLVFARPRAASATVSGLRRRESAVHLQASWLVHVMPKLDVAVGVGPSIFSVGHDFIEGITVTERPGSTPAVGPTRVTRARESGGGFNIGLDGTYVLAERYGAAFGAGVFLRYAGASVTVALANGTRAELDAGGFQFGVGLRARF